jgi:hypothetical protein
MKAVVDDFIGRIIAALQLVCYFIDSHHPVGKKYYVDFLVFPLIVSVDGWFGIFIGDSCSYNVEFISPFIDTVLWTNTVIILC